MYTLGQIGQMTNSDVHWNSSPSHELSSFDLSNRLIEAFWDRMQPHHVSPEEGSPWRSVDCRLHQFPPSWTSTCRVNKNGQLTHHPNAWIAPTHLLVTWLYSWHLPMRSQQLGSSFAGGSLQSTAKVCEFKWQNLSEHKHHHKYRQFSTST